MEKYFIAAMSNAQWLGNISILRLLKFFGTAEKAWFAERAELKKARLNKNALESFLAWRKEHPDAPKQLADYCERNHIGLCSYVDNDYPPILKEITIPPMFFYYRGKLKPLVERIGIVGSRHNTEYGRKVALELGENLAAAGITVVSGAARGIDTFAHRGALKSGRTVAVLGHGINIVGSGDRRKLLEQIAENGLVMSEFHFNFPPAEGTFPRRNRIIAGLCRGVIVVEAGKKSGALITSTFANDEGRDVFCVPGEIYSEMSVGCHDLIYDGAYLIRNAEDVLTHYNYNINPPKKKFPVQENLFDRKFFKPKKISAPKSPPVELDDVEAKIFKVIPADGFITDDEILDKIDDIEPQELPQILLELELKNCIVENAGRYTRK